MTHSQNQFLKAAIRWGARVWSLASILFAAALLFGDHEKSASWPTLQEWSMLIFFPIGLVIGLIVGWWRERSGGWVAIGSLAAFYLTHFLIAGEFPGGPWFALLAAPGLLFLVSAQLRDNAPTMARGPNSPEITYPT